MSLLNANIITGNHIHVILTCVSLLHFTVSAPHILRYIVRLNLMSEREKISTQVKMNSVSNLCWEFVWQWNCMITVLSFWQKIGVDIYLILLCLCD